MEFLTGTTNDTPWMKTSGCDLGVTSTRWYWGQRVVDDIWWWRGGDGAVCVGMEEWRTDGAVWKVCAVVGFLGVVVDARSEGVALVSGGVG